MKKISLKSPAKLNLLLKVVNKRLDGYHDLLTVFERIDLCDEIVFAENKSGAIRLFCSHPDIPKDEKNLIIQVAQILKKDFSVPSGVNITLKKKIPVAAGLGGGSSNAATALLGLNKLWKLSLKPKKLLEYAKKVGSDVAFFLAEQTWALGTERGDKIKPLKLRAKLWHILIVPELKVYSGEVFKALQPPKMNILTKKDDDVNILTRALRDNDLPRIEGLLSNDLETAIVQLHPNLVPMREKIRELTKSRIIFSGSGPALFGLARSRRDAENFKFILSKYFKRVFAVRSF
ncbi:MAG: 4-(cytidine 5'-diphospho)-2-C-methyl-D-erythritol kinase [Candidatus Omnitrophota bacterium]